MRISEAHKYLKELLKLKDFGKSPNEIGEYLIFSGSNQSSIGSDELSFKVLIQQRSFNYDSSGVIARLDEIRDILFKESINKPNDLSFDIDFKGFEDSLCIYEININLKVCRK